MNAVSLSTAADAAAEHAHATGSRREAPADTAAASGPPVESEMKFSLQPEHAPALLEAVTLRQLATGQAVTRQLSSTYYDSHQHILRKAGGALRVRTRGGAHEQTVKWPCPGPVGMQNCEEWTVALGSAQPNLQLLDAQAAGRLRRGGADLKLRPVFTSEIRRTTLVLGRGASRFEMAIDIGEIYSHGSQPRSMPVNEVEFELLQGSPRAMLDLVIELCVQFELVPLHLSKAQRGYALARPALQPGPVRAGQPALAADMTVGEAFQAIAADALGQLHGNHQPALQAMPGGIHQARVAIRRIRAALSAFSKHLPARQRRAYNKEFRWLQSHLAPARDWHVLLSETLPRIGADNPRHENALSQLRRAALRARRESLADARAVLVSRRYAQLVLQFQRWLLEMEDADDAGLQRQLLPFAAAALDSARLHLLQDQRPLSQMSEEERHRLRKRGKKARYATEFFAGLWQGREADRYVKKMEKLQDRLGEANDAVVARQLLASLQPAHAAGRAATDAVATWCEERIARKATSGQRAWRSFQRASPFWH